MCIRDRVEAALLSRGVEAETYADILDDAVGANMLFIQLVQGFMALGLIVGVAALGVISARAVVERRQQLGMLRAIGFQPEMIRRALLAETSIVAFTAIAAGTILGLVLSYNVIADSSNQLGSNVTFAVPWVNLGVIFAAVILAALLTTLLSAHRATRIYPAEALRYQWGSPLRWRPISADRPMCPGRQPVPSRWVRTWTSLDPLGDSVRVAGGVAQWFRAAAF
jgi:putative ABC transport system permease protein